MKPIEAKKALGFQKGDPVYFIDGAGNMVHGTYDRLQLFQDNDICEEILGHLIYINLKGVSGPVLCFVRHKALKRGQCNDVVAVS